MIFREVVKEKVTSLFFEEGLDMSIVEEGYNSYLEQSYRTSVIKRNPYISEGCYKRYRSGDKHYGMGYTLEQLNLAKSWFHGWDWACLIENMPSYKIHKYKRMWKK